MIYTLPDKPAPVIADSSFVADSADLIGAVSVGEQASVWFNCVLRGDNEMIQIGDRSNVQDCSVMHTDPGCPLIIEHDVTIGHSTMLHGCRVQSGSLIGIGSIILNNAVVGKNSLVGANSLITEGKIFPENSLIMGSPAKLVRELTEKEIENLKESVLIYINKIHRYRNLIRVEN